VLCLLLLSPLVEYLTGSTQLSAIILNPVLFLILLVQNLAFYGPGVLLIREARIHWRKGWASILVLGAAYGILEEGVGTGVLFNPNTVFLGGLATRGRWLGVNWINVAILVPIVHPLFSISLPNLLLDLALPETRGRSLLSSRAIRLIFVIFAIDVGATSYFVTTVLAQFYAGPVLLAGSFVAIAILVWTARHVPSDLLKALKLLPSARSVRFAILGVAFPWIIFLGGSLLLVLNAPPVILAAAILVIGILALYWVLRNIGRRENELRKVSLAAGLVVGLVPMGISSQIGTGVGLLAVLAGDLIAIIFLSHLWRKYASSRNFETQMILGVKSMPTTTSRRAIFQNT